MYSVMASEYLSAIFLTTEKIQECVEKLGFLQCFGEIAKLHSMFSAHKCNRNWVASRDQVIFLFAAKGIIQLKLVNK